jgi:hypothetical protein
MGEAPAAPLESIGAVNDLSVNDLPESVNATRARQTFAGPVAQTSPRIAITTSTIVPEPALLMPCLAGALLLRRRRTVTLN